MNTNSKQKMTSRLNRIAGQVAGLQRMVEEDRYCVEVLNQISAVRAALDALGVEMLTSHIESCLMGRGHGSEHEQSKAMTEEELLTEMRTALSRFLK